MFREYLHKTVSANPSSYLTLFFYRWILVKRSVSDIQVDQNEPDIRACECTAAWPRSDNATSSPLPWMRSWCRRTPCSRPHVRRLRFGQRGFAVSGLEGASVSAFWPTNEDVCLFIDSSCSRKFFHLNLISDLTSCAILILLHTLGGSSLYHTYFKVYYIQGWSR